MIFIILAKALQIYTFILLARILMTWIPNLDHHHPLVQFLYQVTEPILEPARKLIPPIGMIDISPIVVFIVLGILQDALLRMAY